MKNKHNISDNFRKLMDEVNNPERLYSFQHESEKYDGLLDKVYSDVIDMALDYGITIVDFDTFKKNIEELYIAVNDRSEQVKFLKELVNMANSLRTGAYWKIYGLRIDSKRILESRYIVDGFLSGMVKELEDFAESEKGRGNFVDDILIQQLKSYLKGEKINYPKGHLKDGTLYFSSLEQYLIDSIDFSYQDLDRESAAQSLALCFLGKKPYHIDKTGYHEDGWNISIKECAFIYDLLYYCGYIDEESLEDKNLEVYPEKEKYNIIRNYFGKGVKKAK